MHRSFLTRSLHAALALAIVIQLLGIGLAELPKPGVSGNAAFALHQIVGLTVLALLASFWAWTLIRRREHRIGALLPWFSLARRMGLAADLRRHVAALRHRRLPRPEGSTPLASATHGLGLLIATFMASTGTLVFFAMAADNALPSWGRLALEAHKIGSNLMWGYLIGHAGVALLHEFAGHRLLRHILPGAR